MQAPSSKLVGNSNVFLKILEKKVEFIFENFDKVENNLIYAKAT
jgi:hypothetical protein